MEDWFEQRTNTRFDKEGGTVSISVGSQDGNVSCYVILVNGYFSYLKVYPENGSVQPDLEYSILDEHKFTAIPVSLSMVGKNNLQCDEQPWMLTEYIPGCTLHEFMSAAHQRGMKLMPFYKYMILFGIAATLKSLHENEIVHRNVYPGNICLDSNLQPYLINLGQAASDEKLTKNVHGSYNFIPPEGFNPTFEATTNYDIFSFGGVIFEIITGTQPYEYVTDIEEMKLMIMKGQFDERFENPHELGILFNDQYLYSMLPKFWAAQPNKRVDSKTAAEQIYELAQYYLSSQDFPYFELYAKSIVQQKERDIKGKYEEVKDSIEMGFGILSSIKTIQEFMKISGPSSVDELLNRFCYRPDPREYWQPS